MTPLSILHVTPYTGRAWAYGGIPRVIAALTRAQADAGHRVTICATDAGSAATRLVRDARSSPVDERLFPNLSNYFAYHYQAFAPVGLTAFLKNSASRFDVAHLHACRNLPGVIAADLVSRAGVPFVQTPNGTAVNIERRRGIKRLFDRVYGGPLFTSAAAFTAVSESERRLLVALGAPAHRVHVIPNPVEVADAARASGARFRAEQGIAVDAPLVLYLGRLSPRKRVDVLLRAFAAASLDTTTLVIAGSDMGVEAQLRRLATELAVSARTIFTGLIAGPARFDALAAADVVVYAGEDEIFGLVAAEALLVGTPVIVADDSGCAEIARSAGGSVTVPPRDTAALTAALRTVMSDRDRMKARAAAAASWVVDRLAPATVCRELDRVYRAILSDEPVHADAAHV